MNRSLKFRKWIPFAVSILYIILFAYAAVSKLIEFDQFKAQLRQSPILSAIANWVSWSVPLMELGIAGLLMFAKSRLFALYAGLSLMVMFTTYIILILNFSEFVPCACGGVLEDLGWTGHIIFNLGYLVIAILAIVALEQRPTHHITV